MTPSANVIEKISIVASDLDGTLLAPDHQLSEYTKQTLQKLHKQGYTFIFATGRNHIDVAYIRKVAGIPAYMITANGARVHDQEDKLMHSNNVDSSLVQGIVDVMRKDPDIMIHLYQDDQWWVNQTDEKILAFSKNSGFKFKLFEQNNAPTTEIAKLFFTHPSHEHLVTFEEELNKKFGQQVNVAFSTPTCLEVMAGSVSKGHALEVVAKSLGKELENCIAFGDGMNDVEMLTAAKIGNIMGTAHIRVKEALPNNPVIGSNKDDAVAHYLEQHLLG